MCGSFGRKTHYWCQRRFPDLTFAPGWHLLNFFQDSLNLFTFSLEKAMGRSRLERDGCYHVADLVTKFLRGRFDLKWER